MGEPGFPAVFRDRRRDGRVLQGSPQKQELLIFVKPHWPMGRLPAFPKGKVRQWAPRGPVLNLQFDSFHPAVGRLGNKHAKAKLENEFVLRKIRVRIRHDRVSGHSVERQIVAEILFVVFCEVVHQPFDSGGAHLNFLPPNRRRNPENHVGEHFAGFFQPSTLVVFKTDAAVVVQSPPKTARIPSAAAIAGIPQGLGIEGQVGLLPF